MSTSLTFQSTTFDVIDRNGQTWVQSRQLASALGYKDERSVHKIYERNKDEFSESMVGVVKLTTPLGGQQESRIFSLRGAHLVAMFARTQIAKAFRVWVLDVLETLNGVQSATHSHPALDTTTRLSKRGDLERKELHALVNTWVGCAPLHYAAANGIVNAYIGVKGVDEMTVDQVREAITFARQKIIEAQAPQPLLPATTNTEDRIESDFLRIRSLVREIADLERNIYATIKQSRGDVFRTLDARRSAMVNMHTVMDNIFYALDYGLKAAESHAKSMCIMSRV